MSAAYTYLRAAVVRAYPDAWLHPDGRGFVVRDGRDRPLGLKAYSAEKAWGNAYEVLKANGFS